jgi:hypothetical protein
MMNELVELFGLERAIALTVAVAASIAALLS